MKISMKIMPLSHGSRYERLNGQPNYERIKLLGDLNYAFTIHWRLNTADLRTTFPPSQETPCPAPNCVHKPCTVLCLFGDQE
jgi:hypothetical protein